MADSHSEMKDRTIYIIYIIYIVACTLPGLILHIFSHIYVHLYCEGGFNTPTKRLQPLTQKSWFIKDLQLKALDQFLRNHTNSTVNMVTLSRHMNVSIKIIENLHRHIKCTVGMVWVHQQLVNIFEHNFILYCVCCIHVFIQ